jgi:hypothetical protein
MLVLTTVSCFQIFFSISHYAQGFGGPTWLVRTGFVRGNWILRSKLDGTLPYDDDDDEDTTPGVDANMPGVGNVLQQMAAFQPASSLSSSSLSSRLLDEIEALGGDPFFFDANDESLSVEFGDNDDDEVDDDAPNNAFGILMDLAMTAGGGSSSSRVLSRIDAPKSTRQNTREEAMVVMPPNKGGNGDGGTSHEVARKDTMEMDEILAMGGDPFFLENTSTSSDDRDAINQDGNSMANNPGLFTTNKEELLPMDIFAQLSSFSSMTQNKVSGAMSILQSLESSTDSEGDDEWTRMMSNDENLLDEIEAMGGDPFFLDMPSVSKLALDEAPKKMTPTRQAVLGSITSLFGEDKETNDNDSSLLDEIEAIGGDSSFLDDIPTPSDFARDEASKRTSILQQLGSIASLERDDELAMDDDVDLLDEIEAMGGDPFFLDVPSSSNVVSNKASKTRSMVERFGSLTTFNRDDDDDNEDGDVNFLDDSDDMGGDPSFLGMVNPNLLRRLGSTKNQDQEDKVPPFVSDDANVLDEIEAMGGDPSFLDPNLLLAVDSFTVSQKFRFDILGIQDEGTDGLSEEGTDWEWDGLVEEDAHLDIF